MAASLLTFGLVGHVVLGFIILGLLIWAWGAYLDIHEHNPAKVRSTMLGVLGAVTACELGLSLYGLTRPWVFAVSLVVSIWGGVDALLRFPAAHDAESIFSIKQGLLLFAKTLSYAFGINGFRMHVGLFMLILLIDIWGLPVLFLMALPLDPAEQVASDDRDDIDIAVKAWRLTTCQKERQRCLRTCKTWLHRRLFLASQRSPLAKMALCAASPTYRRAFTKDRRSV